MNATPSVAHTRFAPPPAVSRAASSRHLTVDPRQSCGGPPSGGTASSHVLKARCSVLSMNAEAAPRGPIHVAKCCPEASQTASRWSFAVRTGMRVPPWTTAGVGGSGAPSYSVVGTRSGGPGARVDAGVAVDAGSGFPFELKRSSSLEHAAATSKRATATQGALRYPNFDQSPTVINRMISRMISSSFHPFRRTPSYPDVSL